MIEFEDQDDINFFTKEILKKGIEETKAKGMMVDFGEAYPIQKKNTSLEIALKHHNQYPTSYYKAYH